MITAVAGNDDMEMTTFLGLERETLQPLIANARARLAGLESEYMQEYHGVEVMQAKLFKHLRTHYESRDALSLKVRYLKQYLDNLLFQGEEISETIAYEYTKARAKSQREYEEVSTQDEIQAFSAEEEREVKLLYRKLVGLYHPDRFAQDPDKQMICERLSQEINMARDQGNIARLRELADDPNGFLLDQGLSSFDSNNEADLANLRKLYDALYSRILELIDDLKRLRESSDYGLYRLCLEQPFVFDDIAAKQANALISEIERMKKEALRLVEKIRELTGINDPFEYIDY